MKLVFLLSLIGLTLCCNHNGQNYNHGDTWITKNMFKMRCTIQAAGWKTEILSCLTPDGHEIPVNSSKTSNQIDWQCRGSSNGFVTLRHMSGARSEGLNTRTANCVDYDGTARITGSHWIVKTFQFRCDAGGVTSFVGCVLENGEIIPDGEFKKSNDKTIECRKEADGSFTMDTLHFPSTRAANCVDTKGHARVTAAAERIRRVTKHDEILWACRWSAVIGPLAPLRFTIVVAGPYKWNKLEGTGFILYSDANGIIIFVGCIQNGDIIPSGGSKKINDKNVECTKHANGAISMNVSQLPLKSNSNCVDSNQISRKEGEQWTESKFVVHECKNGVAFVVGCKVPGLKQIVPLGGKVTYNGSNVFCEQIDGLYKYYSKGSKP